MEACIDHKVMHMLYSKTIRGIVSSARELDIKRDDIVSLLKEGEQYVLIYYYGDKDGNEQLL